MSTNLPPAPGMPEPRMVSSSDGLSLATYDFGGTGADVLLAHANGFCAAVFAPLVAEMAGWHCTALDARAHGRSGTPQQDMAWERHRDDLLATVDAAELHRPIGIGHSMGGTALLLAEQLRPGTFAGLWLFEPIVFPPTGIDTSENPLAEGALRRRDTFDTAAQAYANYRSKPPLDELSDECLAAYVTYGFAPLEGGGITLRCRPRSEAAGYHMGARHGAWDALGELGCPVVIARGAEVAFGPSAVAPMIAERIPRGHLEEHPELGHFGPLADPVGVATSVRRFAEAL